ncbi:MAG TPA: multiheme c-type cytochrome [Burkholderiaceae bacterium]|nr:multiheme c-type cytochrome [Burkholderiaceae bacterium]
MFARVIGLVLVAGLTLATHLPGSATVWDTVPDEQLKALGLSRDASPKELFDALSTRWRAELTKGKFAKWWEPIPMDQYFAPTLFYEPPPIDIEVTREQCVQCHVGVTHGWVKSWEKSVHARLDEIRALPDTDVRAYKKEIIVEVEDNLRSQGLLAQDARLAQVQCADCHMGIDWKAGNHAKDLRMPDRAVCGSCHVRQFAEAESERDTLSWPQKQWADGHPSHAVDYTANVETATWAALQQREVAAGCTMCHVNQTKCDTCHTRHEFATIDSRRPEACATCHNGVDHNEYEQFMLSKHGTVYQTLGGTWNWHARLADAFAKGGQTGPTCQTCHFEFNGKYTHNLVRKVRWGFLPFKTIADNLDHPWFEERKAAWQTTCSNCHSPRFAKTYLDMVDKGIKHGVDLVEDTRKVVQQLYDDGLLPGQKTNRPPLPEPDKDEPGAFGSLFFSIGNNPTIVDRTFAEMWEQDVARYMKGLQHVNPGGWTYSHGWSNLIKGQTIINEQNTLLRERADLERRVQALEGKGGTKTSMGGSGEPGSGDRGLLASLREDPRLAGGGLAMLGGGLLLGGLVSIRRIRREADEPESERPPVPLIGDDG